MTLVRKLDKTFINTPGFDGLAHPGSKKIEPLSGDMQIVIPTYMREGNQITLSKIPAELLSVTHLVTRESRMSILKESTSQYKGVNYHSVPDEAIGIADTRQLCIDMFPGSKVWMIDDVVGNITFEQSIQPKGAKHHVCEGLDYVDVYNHLSDALDLYAMAGVKETFMNQSHREKVQVDCYRMFGCVAVRTDILSDLGIRYDGMLTKYGSMLHEDYYVQLNLLKRGYPTHCTPQYTHNYGHGIKGGNDTFRTLEVHNHSVLSMVEEFPGLVKYKKKDYKIKNNGKNDLSKRLETTIYMNKAFKNGCKANLQEET